MKIRRENATCYYILLLPYDGGGKTLRCIMTAALDRTSNGDSVVSIGT